jgi:preprotein translocase subunit SecF
MMSDPEATQAARMGKSIVRGIMIGLPVTLIGLTIAIYLMTDNTWSVSAMTALLPGILLGTFGGGFAGMATTMEEH